MTEAETQPTMSSEFDLFDQQDRETFIAAVETWGWEAQLDMATEECGELIVAISRLMRGRNDEDDLVDELADVRIITEQLIEHVGRDRVNQRVDEKMDRVRRRLEEAESDD